MAKKDEVVEEVVEVVEEKVKAKKVKPLVDSDMQELLDRKAGVYQKKK